MNNVFISLEKEIFRGNVLDVGLDNSGIIYNVYKYYDEDLDVDYLEGKEDNEILKSEYYDACVLFFSLHNIFNLNKKKKLLKNINQCLRENGYMYIWDVDKKPLKSLKTNVKVSLPDKSLKNLKINCSNPFTNNSKEKIMNILKDSFEVLDAKHSDDIFSIVCKKRGS
ncbi:class I SAM-dependent methyltransferase [Clostridium sp.]|uniref:class I SAM-dependent methyltransferase n=1 Tax=Clostridium sp. TaxID=1506 RepID=UPI002FCB5FF0